MRDLQSGDTGMYWCTVEIGGIFQPDDKEDVYITVKSDPDLSVVESSVSGQEGGSVSVQCLYSAGYQNEQKQWCRSKPWSCYKVGRTDTSQNSAVQISDDGKRSFSMEMSGLQKSDAGWYWCYIGDLRIPVHLSVNDAPPDTITNTATTATTAVTSVSETEETSISEATSGPATITTNTKSATDPNGEIPLVWVLLAVALGLLLILVNIIVCVLRKKFNKNKTETRERSNNTAVHTVSIEVNGRHHAVWFSIAFSVTVLHHLELL
ncbi:hypothetical protein MHYP_G00237840 [Metynnis hypsauchen]